MDEDPDDDPGPPVSCVQCQLLSAWILLTTSAVAGAESEVVDEPVTSIDIDVTQDAPFDPQAFTCRVCDPVEDETDVSIDWPLITVVFELLSKEYPIVTTLDEEQVEAEALNLNGEATLTPLVG